MVDRSVSIKAQMHLFAEALQSSTLRSPEEARPSKARPYGLDWDVLHLGVSNVTMPPPPYHMSATIYHDSSLESVTDRDIGCENKRPWYCFSPFLNAVGASEQSRIILPSHGPIGLVAIAVTLKGAQRLLFLLSWYGQGMGDGLDFAIRNHLEAGDLTGWTVVPPVFGSWTTKGGDSDIRTGIEDKPANNMMGRPRGVQDTVRQHLKEILANKKGWKVLP